MGLQGPCQWRRPRGMLGTEGSCHIDYKRKEEERKRQHSGEGGHDTTGQRWAEKGCGKPRRSRQVLRVRGADSCGLRSAEKS